MKYEIVIPKNASEPHKIFYDGMLVADVHTGYRDAARIRDFLNHFGEEPQR